MSTAELCGRRRTLSEQPSPPTWPAWTRRSGRNATDSAVSSRVRRRRLADVGRSASLAHPRWQPPPGLPASTRAATSRVTSRSNVRGLRLEATDGPFASGEGPLVNGTTLALIMAMAGRPSYCDDLTGPGVSVLRERCSPERTRDDSGAGSNRKNRPVSLAIVRLAYRPRASPP